MKKLLCLFVLVLAFRAGAQVVVPGFTNKIVLTTTNNVLYVNGRWFWSTNAIGIPSNTIPTMTNTTWGHSGGGLICSDTNWLYISVGPSSNLWKRVAITNW